VSSLSKSAIRRDFAYLARFSKDNFCLFGGGANLPNRQSAKMAGNRIEELRKAQGMTLEELADAVGLSVPYVQRLEKGQRNLSIKHLDSFAAALKVRAREIVTDENDGHIDSIQVAADLGSPHMRSEDVAASIDAGPKKTVRVKGYVGAGGEAHFYRLSDEAFEEVLAPEGSTDCTVAVEIRGTSWGPQMNSWLVFYDDVRSPITEDLLGKPCVVGLADDRILIKVIQRDRNGDYRLVSNNPSEPDIEDAQIEWAAKVTSMKPR